MPTEKSIVHKSCRQLTSADELEFYVDLAINESQRWLEATTREPFLNDDDFLFSLRHGSQLRKVINFLLPRSFSFDEVNPSSAQRKVCYTDEEGKFKPWTNTFCSVCLRLGINRQNLFHPKDLEESLPNEGSANGRYNTETLDRIRRVVVTVYELACLCESSADYSGPRIDRTAIEPLLFCHIDSLNPSRPCANLESRKTFFNVNCADSPTKTTQEVTESEESGCGSSINDPSQHSSSEEMDQQPSCRPDVDPLVRDKVTKYLTEQVVTGAGTPAEDQFSESQFSDNTFRSFSPEEFDHLTSSASTSINVPPPRSHVRTLTKPVQCDFVRHDPHRFVASKPATLAQRAVSQLQLIDLEKKARSSRVIVKDDEVDWLANLNSWKLKRRAMNHGKLIQEGSSHEVRTASSDSIASLKQLPCPPAVVADKDKAAVVTAQDASIVPKVQLHKEVLVRKQGTAVVETTQEMVTLPKETPDANDCQKVSESMACNRTSVIEESRQFGGESNDAHRRSSFLSQTSVSVGQASCPAACSLNLSSAGVNEREKIGIMGNCVRKTTYRSDRTSNPIDITSFISGNGTADQGQRSTLVIQPSPKTTDIVSAEVEQDAGRSITPISRCTSHENTITVQPLRFPSSNMASSAGQRNEDDCHSIMKPSASKQVQVVLRQRSKLNRSFGFTLKGGKNSGVPIQIDSVVTGSPADLAGLKTGYTVTALNGLSVENDYLAKANMLIREAAVVGELDLSIRLDTTSGQNVNLEKPEHFACMPNSEPSSAKANENYTRASFEQRRSRFTGSPIGDQVAHGNMKAENNAKQERMMSGLSKQFISKISEPKCYDLCNLNIAAKTDSGSKLYGLPYGRPLSSSNSADYRVVSMHEQKVPGKISDFVPEYEREAEHSKCGTTTNQCERGEWTVICSSSTGRSSCSSRRTTVDERPTLLRNYDLDTIATNLRSSSAAGVASGTTPYGNCLKSSLDIKPDQIDSSLVKYRYSCLSLNSRPSDATCFRYKLRGDLNGNQNDQYHSVCENEISSSCAKGVAENGYKGSPIHSMYSHWMVREAERKRLSEQSSTAKLGGTYKELKHEGASELKEGQPQGEEFVSVSAKHLCAHCGKELGRGCAMSIESLALFYHLQCFKCHVCGISLGDGAAGADVRVKSSRLHCQSCYSNDYIGYHMSEL
uniref:LIM zinc-binding domain-containing protein n=1 Tax=Trichuris muris TaxID=70415 RepID=A0A5S6QML2_TRIMR